MIPGKGPILVAYGGGVNSVALLVLLASQGVRPVAIVMADPGSERRATLHYRDAVMGPWLRAQGFPSVAGASRKAEGSFRPRVHVRETLREECLRTRTLPSVAYGYKKCSLKYKSEASQWYVARQTWARDAWARGERVVKAIGYDAGEERRVRAELSDRERKRYVPWYPLVEVGIDRDGCETLIREAGLPSPGKSACTFCPNNTLAEWIDVRDNEPDRFAEALEMSRNADLTSPDVVGLMRCNPHGMRQLHVWAEDGYPERRCGVRDDIDGESMPCECAL